MDNTVLFYICAAFLGIILLAGLKRRPKDEAAFFDRVSTKEFQGFLALYIIFHQTIITLINYGFEPLEFEFFYCYGILAVVFFFFCSGYGLIKRQMSDGDYLKGFLRRRVYTVLVPFFICNYIYLTNAILENIMAGEYFGFGELICSFFGIFLINNQMWFAVEIMILYLIFRIVFAKVKKTSTGIIIMTGAVLILMVIGLLSGHSIDPVMSYWFKGEWWYNTVLMFPLGMFYAYKEERINRIIRKGSVPLLIASVILFIPVDHIYRYLIDQSIFWTELDCPETHIYHKLLGLAVETVLELIFLVFVVTIMSRLKFDNPVLKFLGKISLEILMLNFLIVIKLHFIYERFGMAVYLLAVILGTVAVASVVYIIKNIALERRSGLFDGKVE